MKALAEKLESFLDTKDDLHKYDVLVIHVHQSKEEKSSILKHFSTCTGQNMSFKIARATSCVANIGIDCKDLQFIFWLDIPPSIWDLAQKMGHAARSTTATSEHYTYYLFFQLKDIIYLYNPIHDPKERCNNRSYCKQECNDLFDVVKLLGNSKTCHKQLLKIALGNPTGDRTPFPPCGRCSVCRVDIDMWPPLCKQGIWLIIFDVFAGGNAINGKHTVKNVFDAICNYPDSSKHLFSSRSTKKTSVGVVHKVLFILIASGIIDLEYKTENDREAAHVVLCLAKVGALNPQRCLMVNVYWNHINLKEPLMNYN